MTMTASGPGAEPSPLLEIERAVQARAATIDMTSSGANGTLRQLIGDEIDAWNHQHARGLRPYPLLDRAALVETTFRNLAGYGPLGNLLDDDDVWEIMVNAPDAIFVRRHRGASGYHDEAFHDDEHVVRTLTKLLDDAGSHRKLDPAEGLQDAQLGNGARLHIVHRDVGRGGHLMVNIRKFTGVTFHSLDQLVERGMLGVHVAAFLRAAVRARCSIVFAGPPGSGKTTMLSCCAAEVDPTLRVVTAEEVFEVDVPLANVASMQTRGPRNDRPEVDLRRLVAGFLRMSPDVAIVGEVRDREALPLLLALSSGVTGYTTIHAASARQALTRLRFICQLASVGSELPLSALNTLISDSVDLVVHCDRAAGGPIVTEVVAVEDLAGGPDATQFTVTDLFARTGRDEPLAWSGQLPARLARRLRGEGRDVRALLCGGDGAASRPGSSPHHDRSAGRPRS